MPGAITFVCAALVCRGNRLRVTVSSRNQQREVEVDCLDQERSIFEVTLGGGGPRSIQVLVRDEDWLILEIDGQIRDFIVFRRGDDLVVEEADGDSSSFEILDQRRFAVSAGKKPEVEGAVTLKAQMPGKVIQILKQQGDQVEAGEGVAIIESMKMQNQLKSPKSGTIRRCNIHPGENVKAAQLLFEIE